MERATDGEICQSLAPLNFAHTGPAVLAHVSAMMPRDSLPPGGAGSLYAPSMRLRLAILVFLFGLVAGYLLGGQEQSCPGIADEAQLPPPSASKTAIGSSDAPLQMAGAAQHEGAAALHLSSEEEGKLTLLRLEQERSVLLRQVRDLETFAPAERMYRELSWGENDLQCMYKGGRLIWNEGLLQRALMTMAPRDVADACGLADNFREKCGAVRSQLTKDAIDTPERREQWREQVLAPELWAALSETTKSLMELGVSQDIIGQWIEELARGDPDLRTVQSRYLTK